MNLLSSLFISIGIPFFVLSTAQAAAPAVNFFFPAGGQRGKTVDVKVDGAFSKWPVEVWVDGKGVEAKPGAKAGQLTVDIAADAVPGTYYIRLFNDEGASVARPFIVGTLQEIIEQEPNDDFKKPQVLHNTAITINGRFDKVGDVDTFALILKKGQTLVASMEANRTLRSPLDGHLQVMTPDGFVLEHNDDFNGLDPQIVFPVPRDGTYLVRTFAFPAVPDASIRFAGGDKFIYRLTLTTGPFFDYAYPLAAARDSPGKVDMIGWNLPLFMKSLPVTATDNDTRVTLYHPECANTAQVRLEPHPTLGITAANSRAQPRTIELPVTITGRLSQPRFVDCFQFEGKKGQALTFRAESQSLGFPLDPVLNITDHAGKSLAKSQPGKVLGKDTILNFTPKQDGPCVLEVRDLFGMGSSRHVYRLTVGRTEPTFTLKLTTDRLVLIPGKPLEISVTLEPANGFNKNVELEIEGLSAEVVLSTLPAAKNAKTKGNTLILRLTVDKGPLSGPIRILGKSSDENSIVRAAQATVADLGTVTEKLWLTVGK